MRPALSRLSQAPWFAFGAVCGLSELLPDRAYCALDGLLGRIQQRGGAAWVDGFDAVVDRVVARTARGA